MVSLKEHNRVKKILYDELKRKEGVIKDLEKENILLLKSALKQSKRGGELTRLIKKLNKK